jgi:UDP-N-acetylmuramate: L-alanyl-gamma-D-glutamyl-meso-diaminopimelate ligase
MTAAARRELPPLPDLSTLRHVHIIGVCGTAMGTLAAMLADRGYVVSGSDAMAYPPMSTWLEGKGLVIQSGYDGAHIPANTELVVVGNVSRSNNPEAVETIARRLPYLSLPEALRVLFFPTRRCLVATGTHGKTTTSAMTASLLHGAALDPSFFIGGVTVEFDGNYRLGTGDHFVVEGDEYDTAYFDKVPKFWHYPAVAATINNIEFDHVDIYPTLADVTHVFDRFAAQLPKNGTLWVNGDDERAMACAQNATATVRTFGLAASREGARHSLCAIIDGLDDAGTHFTLLEEGVIIGESVLPMVGAFNVRNALGAAGLALSAGVALGTSAELLPSYRGVKKRQELKGVVGGVTVIDDFAHHPSAVRETVEALKARYKTGKLVVAFEAKSNTSRRAVFQDAYPESFAAADIVVLSRPWKKDTLPESELLSIEQLADDIRARGPEVHLIPSVDEIVTVVTPILRKGDVFAGLSGAAFGGLHDKVLAALRRAE